MAKDEKTTSKSSKDKPVIKMIDLQEIKIEENDSSDAMICDINTGICGPVKKEKEGKK